MMHNCRGRGEHRAAMMYVGAGPFEKTVLYIPRHHFKGDLHVCGDGWKTTAWLLAADVRPLDFDKSVVCRQKNVQSLSRVPDCYTSQQGSPALIAIAAEDAP